MADRSRKAEVVEELKAALADRYRIERELGAGGMATVYLAADLKHHRQVAVKVLHPDLATAYGAERFLREIQLTARLDHPHILALLDSGEAAGLLYYVMPYVEGESLRDRLRRERQLPLEDAIEIARQVASALDHAHRRGIIHRDIKPENILLTGAHARVADFGIARAAVAGGEALTQTGIAVGTPTYMSPEQATGSSEVDSRADIYSLGCVVYEMLVGEAPHTGPTPQAILARKLGVSVPSLRLVRSAVPPAVEAAVEKALAVAPADRYATGLQFTEALERGAADRAPKSGRRLERRWILGVAAVLALAVAGAWWGVRRFGGDSSRIRSLVVLPLENLTGDPEQAYFVDGMHEALTAELSQLSALKIISRTSAMRYRGTTKPAPQIARELDVQGLIEGSVVREGDRVRISVQLIHGPSDRHIWARQFDRELRGILRLHTEVARAVASEVDATVTPQEQVRLAEARSVDPKAFELYLLGRHQRNQRTLALATESIANFRKALDQDPEYAPAYAAIADAYFWLGEQGGVAQREACTLASGAVRKAIALDQALAEAQVALANWQLSCEWNWGEAERAYRRAISLDPGSVVAHQFYGRNLGQNAGRFEEGLAELTKAKEIDPLSSIVDGFTSQVHLYARQYARADEVLRAGFTINPDHVLLHHNLGELRLAEGRWAEAVAPL
ncbi:MAG TPA: protein kinase, partial [Gemmatimonadales bacterium]